MDAEWRKEQERVDRVVRLIDGRISQAEREIGGLKEEVVDIRKHFWEDVTVNTDNFDDLLETYYSIRQQAEVLSQRERSHRLVFKQLSVLRKLKDSPYFGRIDFSEAGSDKTEQIYLGIASLPDEQGGDFLIYDWRAPISSLYYDYPPGPASYETPGGTVSGELKLKRQYIIRRGEIRSMFDTGLTIGDDLLKRVLGQNADGRMRSIVATIQREQNRIIRHDRGRLLIVHGAAGSGKTSAALQRIAYLLYKYRGRLLADQIVLFSPNEMFNSYVSTVLPELGEENMQQTTFQEYLEHRLGRSLKLEDPYDQLEYVLTARGEPGYDARLAGIRFKASQEFFRIILAYRRKLETEGLVFRGFRLKGRTVVSAREIAERFYGADSDVKFSSRIARLVEWLNGRLDETEREEIHQPWVDDEIELLSEEEYRKVRHILRKKRTAGDAAFNEYEQERELLGRLVVRKAMKKLRRAVKTLRFIDMLATYRKLFENPQTLATFAEDVPPPDHWAEICRQTLESLDRGVMLYEDATPFLMLQELVGGFQTNMSVRHVLIDEAQDYSPFQFEFLKRLFPGARMTVLGDFNQAIFSHASGASDFTPLKSLFGEEETDVIELTLSYRSTKQIVEFTRGLVQDGRRIAPFDREGDKPVIAVAATGEERDRKIAALIDELQREGIETIAVITKTAAESRRAHETLSGHVEGLRLVTKETRSFEAGVAVIPSYLAKGVEFDAVIVYDVSADIYGREDERRLLYTVCTRAMHRLHLFSVGRPSPLLSDADPDTCEWA